MKGLLFSFASVLCVLGCIAGIITGLVILITDSHISLNHVVLIVVFAALAKLFDRLKMRFLYGVTLGDLLHNRDEPNLKGVELAKRDLEALRRNSQVNCNHGKPASKSGDTEDILIDEDHKTHNSCPTPPPKKSI